MRNEPDFIVIGSGYGGMIPAWQLARAGARVLLIERGLRWKRSDIRQSWDLRYLGKLYDFATSATFSEAYRASRVLGGGSFTNAMMHQRMPSEGFEFIDPDTRRRAWPRGLDRLALDPHSEAVERLLQVRQLQWDEVSRTGGNFARLANDSGLSCDRGSFNVGSNCVRCGFCEAGCGYVDGKLTLADRPFEEAMATGNLTLLQNTSVSKIRAVGSAYEVHCLKTGLPFSTAPEHIAHAPRVIVAAGPLGTVPLLMRSRATLPRLSPALGRWVNNNGDVNFVLEMPRHYPDHQGHKSTNNGGMISYAFWREHRVTMHPGFAPVAVMAGIDVRENRPGALAWGLEHKHYVKRNVINRLVPVNAMRQIPSEMRLDIDGNGVARIENPRTPSVLAHGPHMLRLARRLAEPAGGRVLVTGIPELVLDQGGNHILGGARMSDDPATGVVDPHGQVYGSPGLYVTDAAGIPSTLGINPALTVGANAHRIGARLAAGSRS